MAETLMSAEVAEIPAAAARFLAGSRERLEAAAAAMRALDPRMLVTVARGSSDHAATYLKYVAELAAGVPVASVGPSVASIYGRRLKLDGAVTIGISQSGQSPDIVELMRSARAVEPEPAAVDRGDRRPDRGDRNPGHDLGGVLEVGGGMVRRPARHGDDQPRVGRPHRRGCRRQGRAGAREEPLRHRRDLGDLLAHVGRGLGHGRPSLLLRATIERRRALREPYARPRAMARAPSRPVPRGGRIMPE